MGNARCKCLGGLLLVVIPLAAWSDEVLLGRYASLQAYPTPEQSTPLATVVTMRFPRQVATVGQAVEDLLWRSGYRFVYRQPLDPAVAQLMALPLPEVHRRLGPMPLQTALSTLAGSSFQLLAHPVRREVSFELRPAYSQAPGHPTPGSEPAL